MVLGTNHLVKSSLLGLRFSSIKEIHGWCFQSQALYKATIHLPKTLQNNYVGRVQPEGDRHQGPMTLLIPRSIEFEDPKSASPSPDSKRSLEEEEEADPGPLSPILKPPRSKIRGNSTPMPSLARILGDAGNSRQTKSTSPSTADPKLAASQKLNKRLFVMAHAHAKMTQDLLSLQKDKYESELQATREDWRFENFEGKQEVTILEAECEAMKLAFDTELSVWRSRATASEKRVVQLQAERAVLVREIGELQQEAQEKEMEFGVMLAQSEKRRNDQMGQFGHMMMLSSSLSPCSVEGEDRGS